MVNELRQVMCFGEPLIGFFSKKESQDLPSFQMAIGGDTSNVALGVTKLGHPASYTTRLGNDFFAEKIKEYWIKEQLDIRYVFEDEQHQTGIYFALYDAHGDHQFIYKRQNSATTYYSITDAQKVSLDHLKVFHLSGISQAISKSCIEASFYFMKRCKEFNVLVSYDLNYRRPLWSREYFNSIALYTIGHLADLVSLNLGEAELLGFNGDPEKIVRAILDMGPKFVALKLGKDGCMVGSSEGIQYGKPFEVESGVETTGAGDSLTAAVIVGILEGMSLIQMAQFANAVASKVCAAIGSTSGQPTREEVDRFLAEHVQRK
ncbi:MAG: sugar kinase [Candidatus Atribacteria bacterium]|nr:sugar kinase [Candidatus Atribacteria bacterium]